MPKCDFNKVAKTSDISVGIDGSEDFQIATKIPRFELDFSTNNAWVLPISMTNYLNRYMNIHILDIRETFLKDNPFSTNVKEPPGS